MAPIGFTEVPAFNRPFRNRRESLGGVGCMTFMRRNLGTDLLSADILGEGIYAPGHLGTERVNCSKVLFLLFPLISTNIANWNKCNRIYCKKMHVANMCK